MLKYFIISFCIIMQLNGFAQVVIKEKVNLSPQGDDIESEVATPFYGDISFAMQCQYIGGNQEIIFQGVNVFPGIHFDCNQYLQIYPCGIGQSVYYTIPNQPMGTTINVTSGNCKEVSPNEYEWVSLPVTISPFDENNIAYFTINLGDSINHYGTVGFTAGTPSGCDTAFDCAEENFLPVINLVQQPSGYRGYQCDDTCFAKAFFVPVFDDTINHYSIGSICFNKQLQRWWFNLNDDHSFKFNYVMDICEGNIACYGQILIDDWTDFPPTYDCDSLLSDVRDHKNYGIPKAKYLMRDVALAHEETHKKSFENLTIPLAKDWLDDWLLEDIKTCNDFSTLAEAENYWDEQLKDVYNKWEKMLRFIYRSNTGKLDPTGDKAKEHEIWIHEVTMQDYEWLEEAVRFHYLCLFNPEN